MRENVGFGKAKSRNFLVGILLTIDENEYMCLVVERDETLGLGLFALSRFSPSPVLFKYRAVF